MIICCEDIADDNRCPIVIGGRDLLGRHPGRRVRQCPTSDDHGPENKDPSTPTADGHPPALRLTKSQRRSGRCVCVARRVGSARPPDDEGVYVVSNRVSRDELAKEQDEGLVLALASAVLLDPQPQDAELLLNAAQHIRRRHVQYRILVAFTRLYERGLVTDHQRDRLRTLLTRYSVDADAPLLKQISYTSSLISSRVS